MRVIEVHGGQARCEGLGEVRDLGLVLIAETVRPGDYLLGHRGQALRLLPADEALATLDLLREVLRATGTGASPSHPGKTPENIHTPLGIR